MRTQRIILLFSLILLAASGALAQQDDSPEKERVEKNTAPFSMDYFSGKNAFLVLTTSFDKSGIYIDEKSEITEVKGKMPYPSGRLNIKVMNVNGERILDYFMQDPMEVRSCEDKESRVIRIDKGIIHVPLPVSKEISTIVLSRDDKVVQRVDIQKLIENYWKGRDNQR